MLTVDFIAGLWVGEGYFGISVRRRRYAGKERLVMLPAASCGMNDVRTIYEVSDSLKHWEIPHWVFDHKVKRYAQINIHGFKRLDKFLPWIMPFLTGDKKDCAINLHGYIKYRLALPPGSRITPVDLDFVDVARSLNGHQGAGRTVDTKELRRILRDYTPSPVTGDDIVRAA